MPAFYISNVHRFQGLGQRCRRAAWGRREIFMPCPHHMLIPPVASANERCLDLVLFIFCGQCLPVMGLCFTFCFASCSSVIHGTEFTCSPQEQRKLRCLRHLSSKGGGNWWINALLCLSVWGWRILSQSMSSIPRKLSPGCSRQYWTK